MTDRAGKWGYEEDKQVTGRMGHLLVGTLGMLLMVVVKEAKASDRAEGNIGLRRGETANAAACAHRGRLQL